MDLTPAPADAVARVLDDAHLAGAVLPASDVDVPDIAGAYAVQRALTARRLSRGGRDGCGLSSSGPGT